MQVVAPSASAGYRNRRLAECTWFVKITRADGVEHRLVTHDQRLNHPRVGYDNFSPSPGCVIHTQRLRSGISPHQTELTGPFGDGPNDVKFDDVRADRFEAASVGFEWYNWRYLFLESARYDVYEIDDWEQDEYGWTFRLVSSMQRGTRRVGYQHSRACQNQLGKTIVAPNGTVWSRCSVDTTAHPRKVNNAAVVAVDSRRQFTLRATGVTGFTSVHVDGYFEFGFLQFTAGSNNQLSLPIETSTSTGPEEQTIVLSAPAPFDIALNDTVNITQGCDKQFPTCENEFGNRKDFRAEPFIPGQDSTLRQGNASS